MSKYLQNKVAEHALTLPVASLITALVWLSAGLLVHKWWIQLVFLVISAYLMVELSNNNALLRVRSRMVTSTFLILSSCLPSMFGGLQGGIVCFCFLAAFLLMFQTYQDKAAVGLLFYAFLFIGISSLLEVQTLLFVPLLWLLCLTQLQSLSIRTWAASLLGLITPYWFILPWIIYQQDFGSLTTHFAQLGHFGQSFGYHLLPHGLQLFFLLIVVLFVLSSIHFRSRSFEDRFRLRQLYGFFSWTGIAAALFLLVQPQLYDPLIRIIVICVSPFVAHFFTLTSSRLTNIIFIVSIVLVAAVMGFNLYEFLSVPNTEVSPTPWSGLLTF